MRNFTLTLLTGVVTLLLAVWSLPSLGQCTPDPQYTSTGFFPAVLPVSCENQPYNTTLTVVIPLDTVLTISNPFPLTVNVTIDSIVVNAITDLPPGITFDCNPTSCALPGGAASCIQLSGTPTTAGSYLVDIDANLHVSFGGSPFVFPTVLTDTLEMVVNPGLVASLATTDAACGASDGTAKVNVTSTTGPFTFDWSTGAMTDSIGGLASGAYTVSVTDTNGCMVMLTATIGSSAGDVAIDSAGSTVAWTGCAEDDGGNITLVATGTNGPLTYSWSNNTSMQNLMGVGAGTYSVTVTDQSGCTDVETFTIDAPASLAIAQMGAVTDVSCNGGADGAAAVMASGGQGNLSYLWGTPQMETSTAVTGLSAGTFPVSVTDELGCSKSVDVTIAEPTAIAVTFDVMDETNAGASDGSAMANVSGGTPPYTLSWDTGADSANLVDLGPGIYVLTITDDNGCVLTDSATIMQGPDAIIGLENIAFLNVYPNPSTANFTVDLELSKAENVSMRLVNLHGQVVWRKTFGTAALIQENVSIDQTGIYLLEVEAGSQRHAMKVLIK
ncbi:MAG: T9SS type A sorting domain-containing protein [Bacteroidota bacterium]